MTMRKAALAFLFLVAVHPAFPATRFSVSYAGGSAAYKKGEPLILEVGESYIRFLLPVPAVGSLPRPGKAPMQIAVLPIGTITELAYVGDAYLQKPGAGISLAQVRIRWRRDVGTGEVILNVGSGVNVPMSVPRFGRPLPGSSPWYNGEMSETSPFVRLRKALERATKLKMEDAR